MRSLNKARTWSASLNVKRLRLAVIAIARLTLAATAADSGVRLGIIVVRSSFAIRYFPPSRGKPPLIPAGGGLQKAPVPGRADQDLVDADPRRHAGDEGDGAAEIFGLQHFGLLLFRRNHRPQFQDRRRDLAGRQA